MDLTSPRRTIYKTLSRGIAGARRNQVTVRYIRPGKGVMTVSYRWTLEPTKQPMPSGIVCTLAFSIFVSVCGSGCISTIFRGDDKANGVTAAEDQEEPQPVRLISDVARPWGMDVAVVESVSLVMGLDGTGSDPPPSSQRDELLGEMRTRDVKNPAKVLASPNTSLVLVRGFIAPGMQEGERIDIEVDVPKRSETTSLRGGWLMLTPMRPLAVLDNQIHEGHVLALAEGAIIDRATLEGSDDVALQKRGWILGGGKVKKSRDLGLLLGRTEHWFRIVREVAAAVNGRFYTYDRGQKVGAAEAKRDTFVQLLRPRRYRNNLTRFMKVSLNIPYRFETMSRIDYIRELGRELLALETAEDASVKLEAIGDDAVPKLLDGLQHSESAVRFYSAEALAYLNRGDGIKTLVAVAKNDSALRLRALTALGALEDLDAHESLTALMESDSAETRYGAFSILQELNPQDPTLGRNKNISGFNLFRLATTKVPMVHVSRKNRPEIVLFGQGQQFAATPFVLFAGKQFVVKSDVPGQIVVKRFVGDGGEDARNTGPVLEDVIQAMAELGAEYPQVVQILQESKRQGMLNSRLVFDALPRSGRDYSPSELQLPTEVDAPEDP